MNVVPPERCARNSAVAGSICIRPSAPGRRGARVEARLRVDHGGDQRRVEVLLGRLLADDRRVLQRQRRSAGSRAAPAARATTRPRRATASASSDRAGGAERRRAPPACTVAASSSPPLQSLPNSSPRSCSSTPSMARIADSLCSSSLDVAVVDDHVGRTCGFFLLAELPGVALATSAGARAPGRARRARASSAITAIVAS